MTMDGFRNPQEVHGVKLDNASNHEQDGQDKEADAEPSVTHYCCVDTAGVAHC